MIQVVAFDIGKVLLDFDYGIFVRRMAPRTRMTELELDTFLNQSPLLIEYESGRLTSSEFFNVVQRETDFNGTEAEFAAFFEDIFTPDEAMISLHKQIAEVGIETYTFSNTNEMAVRFMLGEYSFWPRCTGHVLSYEAKAFKPEPGMYDSLEERTGCRGDAIAYVDDRPENIAAGEARGWRCVQHSDADGTRAAFRSFGLPV